MPTGVVLLLCMQQVRYAHALTVECGSLVREAYVYGVETCRGEEIVSQKSEGIQ